LGESVEVAARGGDGDGKAIHFLFKSKK
jgi:hypothetical protein